MYKRLKNFSVKVIGQKIIIDKFDGTIIPIERYKDFKTKIKHECIYGHVFEASPTYILSKQYTKCPRCFPGKCSKIAKKFIKELSKKYGWEIQNTESERGEYCLLIQKDGKDKRFYFDGWVDCLGLIIEFLGNYWHGWSRDSKFSSSKYNQTLERFNLLLSLGYPILHIWEHEYKNGDPPWLIMPRKDKRLIKWAKKNKIPYKISTEMVEI